MQYRLNASKTKLYALAKKYWPDIEPMRKTEFIKYARSRSYSIRFNSLFYRNRVYFSACGGAVLLADDWESEDPDGSVTTGREVHCIGLDELRSFGLLEEIPDRKEGK